jgi:hypothetical protein
MFTILVPVPVKLDPVVLVDVNVKFPPIVKAVLVPVVARSNRDEPLTLKFPATLMDGFSPELSCTTLVPVLRIDRFP